jgi:hypothetical protein
MLRFSWSQWIRIRLLTISKKKSLQRRPSSRRLGFEQLEDRVTPAGPVTIDVTSSTPVRIPLENARVGQVVTLKTVFTTTDVQERTEDSEPLIIEGPGFSKTVYTYGTQTIQVPITQNNEQLTAYIKGADGDEKASITVGDRIVQVKMDFGALAAPWLTFLDDLRKSEEAIETILSGRSR